MPPARFSFSTERIGFFTSLLQRIKPRLDSQAITGFLRECQVEISWVLSGYPEGMSPAKNDSELLKNIAELSYSLNSSLRRLERGTLLALIARLHAEPERGMDLSDAKRCASDLDCFLEQLRNQAMDIKDGPGTPIKIRASEELAWRIAETYVHFFETLPSLRHDSIYTQFLDEVTKNDLPEKFRMCIGKHQMDLANKRASVQLECKMLNRNVSSKLRKHPKTEHG